MLFIAKAIPNPIRNIPIIISLGWIKAAVCVIRQSEIEPSIIAESVIPKPKYQIIPSDIKHPTSYPKKDYGTNNWKTKPRPLYAMPDPPKKWHQPKPANKHKIETRRTQWEKEFIKLSKKIKKEANKG